MRAFSAGRDVCREPCWAPRNCGTGSRALPAFNGPSRVGEFGEEVASGNSHPIRTQRQLKLTPSYTHYLLCNHTIRQAQHDNPWIETLLTRDLDFADVRRYPAPVVFELSPRSHDPVRPPSQRRGQIRFRVQDSQRAQ